MMSANHVKDRLPFRLRERFLSSTELALLPVLQEMANGYYIVCPKVALNDIFYIQRPNENVHFYNKIFRKHVDFLLCEPERMKPAFGVELVRRIAKDDTRTTGKYMAELFMSVGLPLVHVPSNEQYKLADLIPLFQLAVAKVKETEQLRTDNPSDSTPLCPQCGLMMVLRIHREGSQAGKRYYGCMNSPVCDGVAAID